MSDFNAPASSAFNAGHESRLGVRKRPAPFVELLTLLCGQTLSDLEIDAEHFFRGFQFFPTSAGTYRIQLSAVSGFTPYIYIDPTLNTLTSGDLFLDVPNPGAIVSGFVGSVSPLGSGSFAMKLFCPPRAARMTWSATAPAHCLWVDTGTTEINGSTDFFWDPVLNTYSLYWADDLVKVSGTWESGVWNLFIEIYANYDLGDFRAVIIRYEGTASELFDDYSLSLIPYDPMLAPLGLSTRYVTGDPPPSLAPITGGSAEASIEALDPFP